METDLERLGLALRHRRESLGLSRSRVARATGISPVYVGLIEGAVRRSGAGTASSRPSLSVLLPWLRALEFTESEGDDLLALAGHWPLSEHDSAPLELGVPATAPCTPASGDEPRSLVPGQPDDFMKLWLPKRRNTRSAPVNDWDARVEDLLQDAAQVLQLAESHDDAEAYVTTFRTVVDLLRFRLMRTP